MKKFKLALLGKDIAHSKSRLVYRELLKEKLDSYTLLDYQKPQQIPRFSELLNSYDGVSITAPYKRVSAWYLEEVSFDIPNLQFYNTVKALDTGAIVMTNTDFLALREILPSFLNKEKHFVYIWGKGAMGMITHKLLEELNVEHITLSKRDKTLSPVSFKRVSTKKTEVVINCSSRDFYYIGPLDRIDTFYDYNYDQKSQEKHIQSLSVNYIDGLSLLKKQAQFALKFWGIDECH